MGYVGNQTTNSFSSQPSKQDFTGSSGSSITLSHAIASPEDISLYINHVRQEPTTSYTVADTTVSFVGYSISATDDVYVTYNALALQSVVPTDGSVSRAKIADDLSGANLAIDTTSSTFKMTDLTTNAFYRTGTWTPVATSSGATDPTATVFSGTNTEQIGRYERIGDVVHAYFRLTLEVATINYTNNGANTDTLRFTGFPFTVSNITGYYPALAIGDFVNWTSGWLAGYPPMGFMLPNTNTASMKYPTTSGTGDIQIQYFKSSGASLTASVTYKTDDA